MDYPIYVRLSSPVWLSLPFLSLPINLFTSHFNSPGLFSRTFFLNCQAFLYSSFARRFSPGASPHILLVYPGQALNLPASCESVQSFTATYSPIPSFSSFQQGIIYHPANNNALNRL